jgi:hypothetical protein
VQKKAEKAEQDRKAAKRRMKKDFKRKFKEFTRVLQTKFSDESIKKSIRSIVQSVLTPQEGDTNPVEQGFRLEYTVSNGIVMLIAEALTSDSNGNGDCAGGIEGDPPGDSKSSTSSLSIFSSSDGHNDVLPPLPPPQAEIEYSQSHLLPPPQVRRQPQRAPNPAKN